MSDNDHTTGLTRGPMRATLWLVLVISAVANSVASFTDGSWIVHGGLAAVTTLCIAALIILTVRARPIP